MSVALSPLATSQSNNPALSNQSNRTHKKNDSHSFHKNRIYMELTTQRAIPKDSELSIRYTSAFEVYAFSFVLLSKCVQGQELRDIQEAHMCIFLVTLNVQYLNESVC